MYLSFILDVCSRQCPFQGVLILDVLIFRVEEHIFYMNYLIARKKSPYKEKKDKKNEKKKKNPRRRISI